MTCKDKQENNGVCPHHNLQCGWPKCNELEQTPLAVISAKQLSAMFQNLKDVDQNQSGYHWRIGWNAALRQAMDYSMPPCTTPPKREWVKLTDEDIYAVLGKLQDMYNRPPTEDSRIVFAQALDAKLKEKNFD